MNELNFRSFEGKPRTLWRCRVSQSMKSLVICFSSQIKLLALLPVENSLMDRRRQGSHCEIVAERRTLLDRKGDGKTGAGSSGCRFIRIWSPRQGVPTSG